MNYDQASAIVTAALKLVPKEVYGELVKTLEDAKTGDEIDDAAVEYFNIDFGGAVTNIVTELKRRQLGLELEFGDMYTPYLP